MNINTLHCGDTLQLLPQLDLTPNLAILHPPDISTVEKTKTDYFKFLEDVYLGVLNKLHDHGTLVSINTDRRSKGIMAKHYEIMKFMDGKAHLYDYKIWVKSLNTNLFVPTFAHILVYHKSKNGTCKRSKDYLPDVWQIKQEKVKDYPGKDNFPSALVERLILNLSNDGDLIFDPFIGSGTTAIVAKKHSRNYLGFDLESAYIKIASEALST